MEDRRLDKRNRMLKAGTISFGGSAISCTIRNLSESGALLDVESPLGIPRQFTLLIPADDYSSECRVIWITEKQVGVRFARATNKDENA